MSIQRHEHTRHWGVMHACTRSTGYCRYVAPSTLLSTFMRGHTHRASILFIYLAQEVVQSEAIDPDTLFVTVVAVITITGFVLVVTARCGCTYWRQRASGGNWSTLRYEVKITAEEIDLQRVQTGPRKKAYALTSTLNLDWPYGNNPEPIRPGSVAHTKGQLQLALAKARQTGTRPDTSRGVWRPTREQLRGDDTPS